MALIDRLKDATRTTNSIDAVQPPAGPQRPVDLHGANPATSPSPKKEPGEAKAPAYASEPDVIARAYYVEERANERRYYADYQRKNLAIRANDSSISSKQEDLNTIRAMLTLAQARGWSEINVSGTANFRREAWIEAQAAGITAQGHKASDLDRQEADRRRAERGQEPVRPAGRLDENGVKPTAGVPGQAVPSAPQTFPPSPPSTAQNREAEPTRSAPDLHRANSEPGPAAPRRPANVNQEGPAVASSQAPQNLHGANPAPAPATPRRAADASQPSQQAPASVDHRKALREATAELSPDGKLVLAALSEKIDRQMNKLNAEAKLETKAFAAVELVKKEKLEGPVVLSPELRKAATAPEPARAKAPPAPQPAPTPQLQPEPPKRSRGR